MLTLTRKGFYTRYQALVKKWGTQYDTEFTQWLISLEPKKANS
jgi:microbial collagenase